MGKKMARADIISILKQLKNLNNIYEVVIKLFNVVDENNLTVPQIAIQEKMYEEFKILIEPLKITTESGETQYEYNLYTYYSIDYKVIREIYKLKDIKIRNELLNILKHNYYNDFKDLKPLDVNNQSSIHMFNLESVDEIIQYSEVYHQKACIELFEKNIKICGQSKDEILDSNSNFIVNEFYIEIDANYLDIENLYYIKFLEENGLATTLELGTQTVVFLKVQYDPNDTVEDLSNKFLAITERFNYQDILYGRVDLKQLICNSLSVTQYKEVLINRYFKTDNIIENMIIYAKEQLGMESIVYDESENIFWENSEYLMCHKKYLETMKKK